MSKDILDTLVENLFELSPIMHKKLLKFDKCYNEIVLPGNQIVVLLLLNHERTLSSSEIGKKIHISKPQVTSIIDKLIKEGLVDRVHDKGDRRIININITEKGKCYADQILILVKQNIREKLDVLSEENLESLANSLQNIIKILKNMY